MRRVKLLRQLPSTTQHLASKQSGVVSSSLRSLYTPSGTTQPCRYFSTCTVSTFKKVSDAEMREMEEKANQPIPEAELNFPTTDNDNDVRTSTNRLI